MCCDVYSRPRTVFRIISHKVHVEGMTNERETSCDTVADVDFDNVRVSWLNYEQPRILLNERECSKGN